MEIAKCRSGEFNHFFDFFIVYFAICIGWRLLRDISNYNEGRNFEGRTN